MSLQMPPCSALHPPPPRAVVRSLEPAAHARQNCPACQTARFKNFLRSMTDSLLDRFAMISPPFQRGGLPILSSNRMAPFRNTRKTAKIPPPPPPKNELRPEWNSAMRQVVFNIHPAQPGVSSWIWVVVGDIPSAYLPLEDCNSPTEVFKTYMRGMSQWVDLARQGRSDSR